MIVVEVKPSGRRLEIEKRRMRVKEIYKMLELLQMEALVIREGEILTRDRAVSDGDYIEVREVGSRG